MSKQKQDISQTPPTPPAKPKNPTLAIIALILGIVSLVATIRVWVFHDDAMFNVIPIVSIAAMVIGIVAAVRKGGVLAIIGLICGSVGVVVFTVFIIAAIWFAGVFLNSLANPKTPNVTTSTGITVASDWTVEALHGCSDDEQYCDPSFYVKVTLVNNTNATINNVSMAFELYNSSDSNRKSVLGTCVKDFISVAANSRQSFEVSCSRIPSSYICNNTETDDKYCRPFSSVAMVAKLIKAYRQWDCSSFDATTYCNNYEYFYRRE